MDKSKNEEIWKIKIEEIKYKWKWLHNIWSKKIDFIDY